MDGLSVTVLLQVRDLCNSRHAFALLMRTFAFFVIRTVLASVIFFDIVNCDFLCDAQNQKEPKDVDAL